MRSTGTVVYVVSDDLTKGAQVREKNISGIDNEGLAALGSEL